MSTIHPRVVGGLASFAVACLLVLPILADDKEKPGTDLKGWGHAIDPDGDCDVTLKEGAVSMKIPGVSHDFAAELRLQNSPRVLSRVKGDFIAEVRVSGTFRPGPASTIPGRLSYHGAGLLLIKDKENYISLHRGCLYSKDDQKLRHYSNFELRKDADLAISRYEIEIPDQDTYLRLERRGDQVFNAVSPDGVHWTSYDPITLELPETVQLGVVGISSSDVPLAIRFGDFTVFRKAEVE